MPRCLVALGSNLGDRYRQIAAAVDRLRADARLRDVIASSLHETAPVGGPASQATFVNAAATFDTELPPEELLGVLHTIEQQLGRERHARWEARTIDLDLLLYGAAVIETPSLTVPHPRMAYRRFVLSPAAEVADELVHPTTGWTVGELLARLDATPPYVAITGVSRAKVTTLARRIAERCRGRFLADPAEFSGDSTTCDPPSREFQCPIEFLDVRGSLLAAIPWANHDPFVVSDFYLDQSLAYARAANEDSLARVVEKRWQSWRDRVAEPRLVVVLVPPPGTLAGGCRARQLAEALVQLAARRQVAPALVLDARDPERAFDEVVAAIQAMH